MANDWDKLNEKIAADLGKANFNTLQKKTTTADGTVIEYRDFTDLAAANTISRNQKALDLRDTRGIAMRVEVDYD